MTDGNKTAYALGFVHGIASNALPKFLDRPNLIQQGYAQPVTTMVEDIKKLAIHNALTDDVDARIAEALCDIDVDGLSDGALSMEQQGYWITGYYKALRYRKPLSIRERRRRNNWTQDQMAEKMGVSRQMIARWERDDPDLSDGVRKKIEAAFAAAEDSDAINETTGE